MDRQTDIPARIWVPVLAVIAFLIFNAWVRHLPDVPKTPAQQQAEARFDELLEKDRLSLITIPNSAKSAGPPLTHDECMYLETYNGGRFDGDPDIARQRCAPASFSDPEPKPVYIVPRP